MIKAMNIGKVTDIEQARSALIKYADEGTQSLGIDSLKEFIGDPSLANSCMRALQFYKNEGEKYAPKQLDYFLKKENFEKIKKAYDNKGDHNKDDVKTYNDAVHDMNDASNTFNDVNRMLNE